MKSTTMVLATSATATATATETTPNEFDGNVAAYCERLAQKYSNQELPSGCRAYFKVKSSAAVDPFAGMGSGSAISARARRSKGEETHAQVQRRLTTSGRRFSKLEDK